jgi:tetratricopeptide (TPR) repeat protein
MGEKTSIEKNVIDLAVELAAKYPRIQYTFLAIACLAGSQNAERFPALLETTKEVWANRERAFTSFEARKYFPVLYVKIEVSPGIWFDESFGLEAFGYLYAEILQDSKDFVGALKILEKLEATQLSAVSAVDIELSEEKYQDVLESTEEVELEDEATGMLYIMRAAALSELGFHDGALEAIKRVVAKRSLDEEVRNRALWERANIYERQGKRKAALKELEKILLADSKYPDVMSRIEKLRKEENE